MHRFANCSKRHVVEDSVPTSGWQVQKHTPEGLSLFQGTNDSACDMFSIRLLAVALDKILGRGY